jgi:hypothetical protein
MNFRSLTGKNRCSSKDADSVEEWLAKEQGAYFSEMRGAGHFGEMPSLGEAAD